MADDTKLKIVVFGAFGAGKTTMIQTLDPGSKHIEANCAGGTTTVALDFGRIQNNGCNIHIYGTPGQERFEFAREIIARGMDGAVLLVDVTAPPDEFTSHLSDSLHAAQVPFVVFLNRCDGTGADPDAFVGRFGASETWSVSAKDRKQCMDAFLKFAGTLSPRPCGHTSP
ncbi:GTP-binding protein [Methanoregula sp.]|uniref:GTP-binding protein n=1 Tax=Methanoregula sp. TaxID=2052170 RepID=UPI00236EAD59|nr:GTP-binding protein [Methanoregula sp.]MDD1686931.1 GTP-binding protein [Methanoregula sp.]